MNDQNPSPEQPVRARPNRLMFVVGAFVAFVLVAGGILLLLQSVYTKRADNAVIRVFAGALPAAKVGDEKISYKEFLTTRETLKVYLASQAAKDANLAQELTPELEKNGFQRMVREIIVNDIARERNVSVTDEDVRDAFTELVLTTSSTIPNVAQYLEETFHWTEEEFRARVIRPSLLETRLAMSFAGATEADATPEQIEAGYAQFEQEVVKREAGDDVRIYLQF